MATATKGNITRRGKRSWRLKFDIDRDPETGIRKTEFVTVHGTKSEAQAELTRRLNDVNERRYVERSAMTVAEYAQHWLTAIAPSAASAKTLERYEEMIAGHISPRLGSVPLQKLDATQIDEFYGHLRTNGRRDGSGGLSPQTVRHIHRLLSQILRSAVKGKKLYQSPMLAVQTTPKVRREEVQILDQADLATLYRHLVGKPLYMPVVLAANTGMRRGEVLALRWKDIDFDAATLQVAQVIEQTKAAIALKEPKTNRSRRTISLGTELVQLLRGHRREQSEWRLRNGLGKDPLDLVFPSWDGTLRDPRIFTKQFSREVREASLPHVTFHGLRHTHLSHLLRKGVPVHVVSERAGHANATITWGVYAHTLPGDQDDAVKIADEALKAALQE